MENTQGKAEDFFSKAGKRIDELVEELKQSDIAKKIDLKERLAELKRNKEKLQKDFEGFTDDNRQNFKDIVDSFEESFQDIRAAFQKATKSKK
jgi:DNA repair exonuclease SbcCD ATPase subunit